MSWSIRTMFFAVAAVLLVDSFDPSSLRAETWRGWMGDGRDGVYRPGGDLTPEDIEVGPQSRVLWRQDVGGGYAGPAVTKDKVFVFEYQLGGGVVENDPGRRVNLRGSERLLCLDVDTGNIVWQHAYECPYSISYPAGPRCTPTVDGDHVYTLGAEGDLRCLRIADGELVWQKSLKQDFSAEVPIWGFASHPLVDGDLLYTMVGGPGQGVVAMDKLTGEVRWKALDARAGYCPPSIIDAGGQRQLIVYHPEAVVGMNPDDGSVYWTVPAKPAYDMSITRPMVDGNKMFVSAIRTEAMLLSLNPNEADAKEVWYAEPKSAVHCANSTPLFVDGVIYGTDCNDGTLIAVDATDGSRLWTTFQATRPEEERFVKHGTAFLTRIGQSDRYLLMSEIGDLIVAKLTRDGYQEIGRKHILEPTGEAFGRDVVWSHPAYAGGVAFARNDKEIVAVSIRK